MWLRRSFVSARSGIRVMSSPPTCTLPSVGRSRPGQQVHERRLARARRAHDGGELAARDLERHAAQGVHGGLAVAVAARHGAWRPRPARRWWQRLEGGEWRAASFLRGWGSAGNGLARHARDRGVQQAGGEQARRGLGEDAAQQPAARAQADRRAHLAAARGGRRGRSARRGRPVRRPTAPAARRPPRARARRSRRCARRAGRVTRARLPALSRSSCRPDTSKATGAQRRQACGSVRTSRTATGSAPTVVVVVQVLMGEDRPSRAIRRRQPG